MIRLRMVLFLAFLFPVFAVRAQDAATSSLPPKDKLRVYLVLGGEKLVKPATAASEEVIARCYLLNADGQWEPARGSLNRYSTIAGESELNGMGPVDGFVVEMLKQNPDLNIGLVVNQGADARLEDWNMKSRYYREARRRAKQALKQGTPAGILWHGGGSVNPLRTDLDHLKNLIADLRTDLRALNLPVVVGELPGDASGSEQLRHLVVDVHAVGLAKLEDGPAAGGKGLSEQAMLGLGQRYAEAMKALHGEWTARQTLKKPSMPLIDAHVHALSNQPGGLDKVAAWMERNGVERVIESPIGGARAVTPEQRAIMLENFKKYRGRMDRMCLIEPGEVATVDEAVRILEKEKEEGAVAFGEHYGVGLMFDDPKNLLLYEACQKVGLPVMFHIDSSKNMVEAGMSRVDRVLSLYPDCRVIAHAYWWLQFPDGICQRMMKDHPNLYADVSGLKMVSILNRERNRTRQFLIDHADRVMFCSDAGWWSYNAGPEDRELQFSLFEELDLPKEVLKKIYRDNAIKLFGLKENEPKAPLESRHDLHAGDDQAMAAVPRPPCCAE